MRYFIFILCLVQYQVQASDWLNRTVRVDFIDIRKAARPRYDLFEESPRIITDGVDATNGQYPWSIHTLSLSRIGSGFFCSGTIISDSFFLSDLRCVGQQIDPPANSMGIFVGSAQWLRHDATNFVRHFWYIAPSPENSPNIVLCRIHEPLTFNPNVQPIRLPYTANANFTYEAWSSLILGYRVGVIHQSQFVQTNIFNNSLCNFNGSIAEHEMCGIAGNDPLESGSVIRYSGITGGAWMVYEYAPDLDLHPVVIGIHRYQYANQTASYGLATRVSHFLEWIDTLSGGIS